MIGILKAELRKMLTVRSTYIIFLLVFLIPVALTSFWIYGYKNVEHAAQNANALSNALISSMSLTGVLLSFLAVLAVGHEYRYNTILYSLTSSNRRIKVFLGKFLAVLFVALIAAAVTAGLSYIGFHIGQNLAHIDAVAQTMPGLNFAWRMLAAVVGSIAFAYILSMLLRSLIGAVAVLLILPTTIEPLLSLLLKENVKYLPYTALGNLSTPSPKVDHLTSLWIVIAYAVVLGAISLALFIKRDAN